MKLGLSADRSSAAVAHRVRHLRVSGLALAAVLCLAAAPGDAASRDATPHARHLAKAKAAKAKTETFKAAKAKPAEDVKAVSVAEEKTADRVTPAGMWTSGEGERACYKGRRKLWQDGQGWVVKRVAVCP